MRDAKPIQCLFIIQVFAAIAVVAWMGLRPVNERFLLLAMISTREGATTLPPWEFVSQLQWLAAHRLHTLQQFGGVIMLGSLIGIVEGSIARRADLWQGMRFGRWTCAMLLSALLPGIIAGWLVWPWPMAGEWGWLHMTTIHGLSFTLYSTIVGWLFTSGRPRIR